MAQIPVLEPHQIKFLLLVVEEGRELFVSVTQAVLTQQQMVDRVVVEPAHMALDLLITH